MLGPVTPLEPETVGRAESSAGEVLLRTRGTVTELIVGGVFVMDTVDVSTEVELARVALARHPRPTRVLVGGLGLGFTAAAVLADSRVGEVRVVEIAEPLSRWAEEGLLPAPGLADERLTVEVGDVRTVLESTSGAWNVVLLDVDNGPGFLVRPENTDLYAAVGLRRAVAALAPGGVLGIWSSHRADDLSAALHGIPGGRVEEVVRTVHREGREFDYAIYLLTTADPGQNDLAASRIPE